MKLNECYSVPDSVINEMTNLDPSLRLTWDPERQKVRVERKITYGIPLNPDLVSRVSDLRMANEGYCLWLSFEPSQDNYDKLLYTIRIMDMWKQGGANAIADTLEADEERERLERKRGWKSDLHQMSAEMFRHLNTPRTGWNPYEVKAD